jgi:hypothetical protein
MVRSFRRPLLDPAAALDSPSGTSLTVCFSLPMSLRRCSRASSALPFRAQDHTAKLPGCAAHRKMAVSIDETGHSRIPFVSDRN